MCQPSSTAHEDCGLCEKCAAGNCETESAEEDLKNDCGVQSCTDLLYGNVGTPSRIEFTVVGAAANEAARIEALCKSLGAPLLISEPVARHLPAELRSLGPQRLRGVGEPIELFTCKTLA